MDEYKDDEAQKQSKLTNPNECDIENYISMLFQENIYQQITGFHILKQLAKRNPHIFTDQDILRKIMEILKYPQDDLGINSEIQESSLTTRHDLYFEFLETLANTSNEIRDIVFYENDEVINSIFDEISLNPMPQVLKAILGVVYVLCQHNSDFSQYFTENFLENAAELFQLAKTFKTPSEKHYCIQSLLKILPYIFQKFTLENQQVPPFVFEIIIYAFELKESTDVIKLALSSISNIIIVLDGNNCDSLVNPDFIHKALELVTSKNVDIQLNAMICLRNYSSLDDSLVMPLVQFGVLEIDYSQLENDKIQKEYWEMIKNISACSDLDILAAFEASTCFQLILQADYDTVPYFFSNSAAIIVSRILSRDTSFAQRIINNYHTLLDVVLRSIESIRKDDVFPVLKMIYNLIKIINIDPNGFITPLIVEKLQNEDLVEFIEESTDSDNKRVETLAEKILSELPQDQE